MLAMSTAPMTTTALSGRGGGRKARAAGWAGPRPRPAVSEHGRGRELTRSPAEQAEDQQMVAGRPGRGLPIDDQVIPGSDHLIGGRDELRPERRPVVRENAGGQPPGG